MNRSSPQRRARTRVAAASFTSLGVLLYAAMCHAQAARPNVVVILADDMGWGDLSFNGNTNLSTPHIDSLAREGAHFERFFVQPVCAPTRAEFLTGRYHPRGGVRGVSTGAERLDLDERTIAEAFRAAGYATGCFGKWHNGSQYPYHPNGRGFDEYYGFTSGHWGEYFDPPLDDNGRDVRGKGYLADDVTGRAIDYMHEAHGMGRPFFAYVAFNTPHSPMQVPDAYWNEFADADFKLRGSKRKLEEVQHTRAALAMCENLDANVGRILTAIDKLQVRENTIVLFFSDNGPNGHRWNGGMKGIKGTTDEGGVRSPLFMRWPEHIDAGRVIKPIAGAIDLYPTIAALAGVSLVGDKPLDGVDLSPLLQGADYVNNRPSRVLIQHWAGKTSARNDRYRLDAAGRLYDMAADPTQIHDIADTHPAEARQLREAVDDWRTEVLAELPHEDDRPFPVGVDQIRATTLPARDGQPHGGVERSANAPNCSYFTNWTSTNDRMTWEIDVANAGEYEAQIAYTAPPAAAGSTIQLSFGDAAWSSRIETAHDPPRRGHEHDRSPRKGESYVKDFKLLSLGTARIRAGRGTLVLKAADVAGNQVADVRHVRLIPSLSRRAVE